MSEGPSLAWMLATSAASHVLDKQPLDPGISIADVGRWRVVVNNSKLSAVPIIDGVEVELPPFEVYISHRDYIVFGLLGPRAGMIGGGYSEDRFIDDMVAALPPSALAPFADELGYRKETRS